jgi:hypothetical protein
MRHECKIILYAAMLHDRMQTDLWLPHSGGCDTHATHHCIYSYASNYHVIYQVMYDHVFRVYLKSNYKLSHIQFYTKTHNSKLRKIKLLLSQSISSSSPASSTIKSAISSSSSLSSSSSSSKMIISRLSNSSSPSPSPP